MDIIFQSGEFYNETSFWEIFLEPLATLISVLASGIFGVYLFNKGIKKDRALANEQRKEDYNHNIELETERRKKADEEKEKIRIENLIKFGHLFQTLLSSTIHSSEKQLAEYQSFIKNLTLDILGLHFPKLLTHENLKRLLKLKENDLLEYVEYMHLTNKDFVNLLTSLDYLNTIFDAIANDVNEGNNKISLKLRNHLIVIRNRILEISTEFLRKQQEENPSYSVDDLYNIVNKMVLDYLQNNDGIPNPNVDYEKLISVIISKLLINQHRFNPLCIELIDLAKQGGDIVFSIRQINEKFIKDMTIASDRIKSSIEILKKFETINQ